MDRKVRFALLILVNLYCSELEKIKRIGSKYSMILIFCNISIMQACHVYYLNERLALSFKMLQKWSEYYQCDEILQDDY